jgi:hypothetical protein
MLCCFFGLIWRLRIRFITEYKVMNLIVDVFNGTGSTVYLWVFSGHLLFFVFYVSVLS